jgi:DNA polymerase V
MQLYIDYSVQIYGVYLRYIAPEDIHIYSIDEVFMDVAPYLKLYGKTAVQLGREIREAVFNETGITASCGVGSNMYLAKIAMDITAKHTKDGMGILDEEIYCKTLWEHKPLTDFWRIGRGTAERLAHFGINTMGQIAATDEDFLYRLFGIDAELLIDHAYGRESVTMADIKAYKPKSNSLTSSQVLMCDYSFEDCRIIVKEMTAQLCLDMTGQGKTAQSATLKIGYSNELKLESVSGTANFGKDESSVSEITAKVVRLYERITDRRYPIRRLAISFNKVKDKATRQSSLFEDTRAIMREEMMEKAVIEIKRRFGKNAVVRGMSLDKAATGMQRNKQIGGHSSGC